MHPLLIDLGFFRLSTYGVLVALGYLTAILWVRTQIRWMPGMNEDRFWRLIYAVFFGALLGGKILYLAVSWNPSAAWTQIFKDLRYGFVFYGGLLGALLTAWAALRWMGLPFAAVSDYFGVALPLGHAVGRLGCLGSGCCYGKPTSLPWGVVLGASPWSTTPQRLWGVPLHPTQLYEALANLAIAALLLRFLLPLAREKRLVPGTVFLAYLALYSAARFLLEFFRGDDRGWSWGPLSISQGIALALLLGACLLMARRGPSARP